MMGARLRGVVVGHGHMGRLHAAALSAREDVTLEVVDPAQGLRGSGGPWDFAVIATPTSTHHAVTLPLLERGVACLVEKPLAGNIDDAQELARWARLSVGHVERFNPALAVLAGVRPRFVEAERLAPFPARSTDTDVVRDLMIHDLDLALVLLPGEVTDLRAVGVGVLTGRTDIANARLEITTDPGLPPAVVQLTASRVSRSPVRKLRLVEDGVYWSVDLHARTVLRVRWGEGDLEAEPVAVPAGDPLAREHEAFLAAVRGEAAFPVPGAEALRALGLAEAVIARLSPGAAHR